MDLKLNTVSQTRNDYRTDPEILPAMNIPKLKKPFSMIREFQLADWFTLANAVCGTGALFSVLTYLQTDDVTHIYYACGMVVAALVFDVLDGRIARWRQKNSIMGRELDSLADIISFGVAPAVIGYGCGMQGLYDRIILTCFVACGVSRLARYNVTAEALSGDEGKVKYFEGTPIPTSLLLVMLMFWAAWQGALRESLWFGHVVIAGFTLHPIVLLFAVSGSLMVSRIRFPKF
jgi:CDP-diacylglycerol--serine O-phosphatidyltransferase